MPFRFFSQGLPLNLVSYYFYVEGIGFAIAIIFFYRVLVMKGGQFPRRLFEAFETPVIDRSFNERIARGVLLLSHWLRRVHTGNMSAYLFWVALGLLFVVLMTIVITGGAWEA